MFQLHGKVRKYTILFIYIQMDIYILFQFFFHFKLLQDIEYSSLSYIVGPCCLSILYNVVQFSSVASNSLRPHDHSTPGLSVHHQLPEFIQIHVHQVGDAIQPSNPPLSPSPPAPNPSQHQGQLFA